MAIKPWKGAIFPPTKKVVVDTTPPQSHLNLEWVHGYRVEDCLSNVRYLADGKSIVFNAAGVGVVMSFTGEAGGGKRQKFFLEHQDDVISIGVSPPIGSQQLVATGDIGKKPRIEVWDPCSLRSLYSFQGFHSRGVACVEFSEDAKRLVSIGLDDDHSVAIYDVGGEGGGRMLASAKGSKAKVLSCQWNPYWNKSKGSQKIHFLTCGGKSLDFWSFDNNNRLTSQKAVFKDKKIVSFTAATFLPGDGNAVVGTSTGAFYVFNGREIARVLDSTSGVSAHEGPVLSISRHSKQVFVTGGKDGKAYVWKNFENRSSEIKKEEVQGIDLSRITPMDKSIRSVQISPDGSKVLLGLQGSEIFEVDLHNGVVSTGRALLQGHYKGELWGLCSHPMQDHFATVGDDATLRIWDLKTHELILPIIPLKGPARACAFSPNGIYLAVGLGPHPKDSTIDGTLLVFEYQSKSTWMLKHETKDAKAWISDIKFSPDGKILAVGSHDNCIYLYSVEQKFKKRAKFSKHNSYITHLDFSKDSQTIQSNCGAYELLYSDTTGHMLTKASAMRDTQWASWTCTLGWPAQGIWPPCSDGTDVNSVDRSKAENLLATGDDFGKVKLFRYPCVQEKISDCHVSVGHSSHVANVRWSGDDTFLISVGGNDKCVFQWRHERGEEVEPAGEGAVKRAKTFGSEPEWGKSDSKIVFQAKLDDEEDAEKEEEEMDWLQGGGDEFMAVKPWIGAIVAPSVPEDLQKLQNELKEQLNLVLRRQGGIREAGKGVLDDKKTLAKALDDEKRSRELIQRVMKGEECKAPDIDGLTLEWIHGYRSEDCRNNIRYCNNGKIAYHAASVGVLLDPEGPKKQIFNTIHTDDIISFAMHPEGTIVATGQMGKTPKIQVWSSTTLELKATLQGYHQGGVMLLQFSSDGKHLASVGQNDDHNIAIYEWANGTLRGTAKGDRGNVLGIDFLPDSLDFITCGVKHVRIWERKGLNLSSKMATLGKEGTNLSYATIGWCQDNTPVIGASDGNLYTFKDAKSRVVAPGKNGRSHKGPIFSSHGSEDRSQLFTGGKDGTIRCWATASEKVELLWFMDIETFSPMEKGVRSVQVDSMGPGCKILFGTISSQIYEVTATKSLSDLGSEHGDVSSLFVNTHQRALVDGHYKDELWGLANHPSKRQYCTVGDDHTLRVWDVPSKKLLKWVDVSGMARSCAYGCGGELIAIGMGGSVGRGRQKVDGTVKVYREESLELIFQSQDAKQWISDLKFSPDGKFLIAGSHDSCIYIYSITRRSNGDKAIEIALKSKFNKHHAYITHFDICQDSRYMQSTCGAYELLFSNIVTGRQIPAAKELKDVQWSSFTCTLGWPVQGIWPACSDGTDVNSVARSHAGSLLASGDDFGKIKIYRYPCVQKGSQSLEYQGHSSHVMNVRWTAFDECLISVGGNDKCVFQWKNNIPFQGDYSVGQAQGGARRLSRGLSASNFGPDTANGNGDNEGLEEKEEDETDFSELDKKFEVGAGDEFMAVKPWLGAIKAPTKYAWPENPHAPQLEVSLEWVHGYAGHSYRSNLFYTASGELAFFSAAVGIIMKVDRSLEGEGERLKDSMGSAEPQSFNHEQKFYLGHDDDIMSLALGPSKRFVATGQMGKQPCIHVWDSTSGTRACNLGASHKRGVAALAFKDDGLRLASAGLDDDHSIIVWKDVGGSWSNGVKEATAKGDSNVVVFVCWLKGVEGDPDAYPLVSGGPKHIKFWKIAGNNLVFKKGVFSNKEPQVPPSHLCATNFAIDGKWRLVTGSLSGEIFLWKGKVCEGSRPAHDKALNCLAAVGELEDGEHSRLITGGKDGKVRVWNTSLQNIMEWNLSELRRSSDPCIKGLDACFTKRVSKSEQGKGGVLALTRIVVGTQGGEIFEIPADTKSLDPQMQPLQQGHFQDEVWGLDVDKSNISLFATTGDDGTVRVWNAQEHRMTAKFVVPRAKSGVTDGADKTKDEKSSGKRPGADGGKKGISTATTQEGARPMSRAVAWSYDGQYLVVGLGGDVGKSKGERKGGHLVLYFDPKADAGLTLCIQGSLEKGWVSDVKFCPQVFPDKQIYAVGGHDRTIYVYQMDNTICERITPNTPPEAPTLRHKFEGHNASITHLDFSNDGAFIQSNCSGYELLFWSLEDDKQERNARKCRDVDWSTWSCVLGWPVQGIWLENGDGSDVNAVDRSDIELNSVGQDANSDQRSPVYLAVGGDDGKLRIYNYPCLSKNSKSVVGSGHASHVSNVKFIPTEKVTNIITTGGNDKSVFQWKVLPL